LVSKEKRIYEAMFLVDSALAATDWDGVTAAVNTVLQRSDAEIIVINKWDERRLCYPIGPCKRGTYILCYFRALPGAIENIERDVQRSETIVRVLVLRADHLSEEEIHAPTPAMRAEKDRPEIKASPDDLEEELDKQDNDLEEEKFIEEAEEESEETVPDVFLDGEEEMLK